MAARRHKEVLPAGDGEEGVDAVGMGRDLVAVRDIHGVHRLPARVERLRRRHERQEMQPWSRFLPIQRVQGGTKRPSGSR